MDKMLELSDRAVLVEMGERLARHRLGRNMTQSVLAKEAGVSKRTLLRIEAGESTQVTNLIRVVRALGLLGNLDGFVPPPIPSPIEQLRLRSKERRRASPGARRAGPSGGWTWGEDQKKSGGEG